MKNICFHHDDPDGRMSAAIVKDAIPDCELVEINYGYDEEKINDLYIIEKHYNNIFVVDFSFPRGIMTDFKKMSNKLIWCDHHKSAMEQYEDLWNDKNIKGLRSLDKSGCRLTWEYFNPGKEVPLAVEYIEDMDLWKFQFGNQTKHFAESLYFEKDIKVYQDLLTNKNLTIRKLVEGEMLYNHKMKRIKKAMTRSYLIEWEGYMTAVVNTPEDISTLGNTLCNLSSCTLAGRPEVALIFYETEDSYNVSLRSIGDIDVSKIAQKYGGGGHKNAAGFNIDKKKDLRTW